MGEDVAVFLAPAPGVECDNPGVIELAARVCAGARDDVAKAEALFLWVRDQIAYTMTAPFWELEHYLASAVIARGKGYCVQKSALLVTLARAAGIPARMCFADIDNLAIAPHVVQMMGGHGFVWHSYAQWLIDGQWRKATPAFDAALCREHGLPVVEFRPGQDLLLPAQTLDGRPYIVYRADHGWRAGLPLAEIMAGWLAHYGPEGVAAFRRMIEEQKEAL